MTAPILLGHHHGKVTTIAEKSLAKSSFSPEMISFLGSLVNISLKVLLVIVVAGIVGVDITALVGVLAAAGFAVGLALQGSLGNFAAGIVLLTLRPYKIGDWVEVAEKFGQIKEVQIFNTIIVTPGNKTHVIPNGQVVEGVITNFSTVGTIRLELNVTIPYAESFPKVKEMLMDAVLEVPGVLQDPEPEIGIETFDSHSIVVSVRPFVLPDDYWPVTFAVNEKIKTTFHEKGVQVAYSEGIELGEIGE